MLAKSLDAINVFITSIIPFAGITFRIFVAQARSHSLHNSLGGEVLRSDKFKAFELSLLLFGDELSDLWILVGERKIRHW